MFLRELKDLPEESNKSSITLQDICDALEAEAYEASFDIISIDSKTARLSASGYQGKDFVVTLTLVGNEIHVQFNGESEDGKHHRREYTWQLSSTKDVAQDIDSTAGSFLHNELDSNKDEDD